VFIISHAFNMPHPSHLLDFITLIMFIEKYKLIYMGYERNQ
jgi:hypothetical protein